MNKLLNALRARFAQPKWRHGKLSALLMAAFIAACVLLNVAVQALEDTYGWRRDMSFNGYASTGAETRAALSQLNSDVDLYLLYQSGMPDMQARQVLDRYAVLSDHITVLPTDIAQNPGVLTLFSGDPDKQPAADTVVVHCPATGRYQLLDYSDFLTQGYNIETGAFEVAGLAYEKRLTEAIVYVSQDRIPMVGVLQGHGELTPAMLDTLLSFLKSNNYNSRAVNLLGGDDLQDVDLLLIACPQNDLSDGEVEQIAAFAKEGHSLWVMRDYSDPAQGMPNYFALLRSYGVTPLDGVVVASTEDAGSYYGEPLYLLPYMELLDMTYPLIDGGMDILLLPAASAFAAPAEADPALSVGTVLKSGPNAYLRDVNDGYTGIERQPNDPTGEFSLALYAHRAHANGNISNLFAIGNSTLFTDEYIYQRTFNEEFILMLMGQLLPHKTVSLDILVPTAFRPALTVGSHNAAIAVVLAAPLLVLIAALCILLPRRNR